MHALWACAMEVVLFIYRVPWAQVALALISLRGSYIVQGDLGLGATGFPWILSVTNILPYDFYKVAFALSSKLGVHVRVGD